MAQAGLRWYLKKAARTSVMFGSWGCGSLAVRHRMARSVRVLTYHRFGADAFDPFCVHPRDFEQQMELLAREERAINLTQLLACISGEQELPRDACLVTIDDGMLSTATEALPILSRWSVPAVAFVSASLVGRPQGEAPERYLDWDELRELAASGVIEIGSHSFTHRSLGLMSEDEAAAEISQSRARLREELSGDIRSFAYPFGTRTDFSPATEAMLADTGFSIAFHSLHGAIRKGMNAMSLPRVKVEGGESLMQFDLVSRGGTDAWRAIDATLWRLQRVRTEIN